MNVYFDMEGSLLFLLLTLFLWVYFVEKYFVTKEAVFVYIQMGVMIPLTILIGAFAFNYVFGYVVIFIIPAISIYLYIHKYEQDKKIMKKLEERGITND